MSESSQEDKTDNKQNGATIDPEQRMEDVRQNIRKAEVEYLYFVILLFCCCCCCSVVDLINKWASEGRGGGGDWSCLTGSPVITISWPASKYKVDELH